MSGTARLILRIIRARLNIQVFNSTSVKTMLLLRWCHHICTTLTNIRTSSRATTSRLRNSYTLRTSTLSSILLRHTPRTRAKHNKVAHLRMRLRLRSRSHTYLIGRSSMPNTWLLRESTGPSHFCNRQCRKFKRNIQCRMTTSKARESTRRPCTRNQASRCRFRTSRSTLRSGRATSVCRQKTRATSNMKSRRQLARPFGVLPAKDLTLPVLNRLVRTI